MKADIHVDPQVLRAAYAGRVVTDVLTVAEQRLYQRALQGEPITRNALDRLANAVGRHPCELTDEWWEEGIRDE